MAAMSIPMVASRRRRQGAKTMGIILESKLRLAQVTVWEILMFPHLAMLSYGCPISAECDAFAYVSVHECN